jgi:hypothetical protein
MMKLVEANVFPSEESTILVEDDLVYGGAHKYQIAACLGFTNGKTVYDYSKAFEFQFVQKDDDGTVTPGLQSEQIVYMLIDRQKKLNARFPSPQNEKALAGLQMFLDAQRERVEERMARGVMGELKK